VVEAWAQYANIDLIPLLENREAMAKLVAERGQTVDASDTWDDLYYKIFLTEIEPKLGAEQPTFLHRYPKSMAALARVSKDDPRFADRVELYLGDLELANGFAELSDSVEQRKRFEEERAFRQKMGKPTWNLDEKFLTALPSMGDAAGIAFGVERLVMLLTRTKSINDILPFPARERFEDA
jgi:lysyl-tRNA synthetase class 2